MGLFPEHIATPLLNSASPWASTEADLASLWACPSTDAITTRTCTLTGYPDDPKKHQVAFFGNKSSINSFGFSPFPLGQYLDWIRNIVSRRDGEEKKKIIIVSIGASDETELEQMLAALDSFARELDWTDLGVEFNASCPNLNDAAPPAYVPALLESYLRVFARYAADPQRRLKFGIKLPPYTYEEQIVAVVRAIETVSKEAKTEAEDDDVVEVVSFLTSTNTLGQGLIFSSQVTEPMRTDDKIAQRPDKAASEEFGVPNGYGGLAGESIHQLSLGNVRRLRSLLNTSRDARVRGITLIGVGGVCDTDGAERFRRAGADAVAVATAFGREGIDVFDKIRNGSPRAGSDRS